MAKLKEKNTRELIRCFKKNKEELRELLSYLDRFCKGWRKDESKYFEQLKKLERALLKK